MWHQMGGDIFNARTAVEVGAHEGADDFAALVALVFASQSQYGACCRDNFGENSFIIGDIPPKVMSFSDLMATFAMSVMIFIVLGWVTLR